MHQPLNALPLQDTELFDLAPNGPRIWRLRFGSSVLDAYLHDVQRWGVAYYLLLNGRFTYSERHPTSDEASAAATARRSMYEADGWRSDSLLAGSRRAASELAS